MPSHLPFTFPDIIDELPFILVSIFPLKDSNAILFIIFKLSLVVIALYTRPNTLSLTQSLGKVALVN
jgi:hypothetical protein